MEYFFLLIGLILFSFGAEGIIRGSVSLAKKFRVSLFAIGIVVISAGTSLPELANCLIAIENGYTDLAVGTIVGSNIANIILIMGMTVLFCPILAINNNQINQIGINLIIALTLILFAYFSFEFNYYVGISFLLLLVLIMLYQIKAGSLGVSDLNDLKEYSLFFSSLFILVGLIFLTIGSQIFISSAVKIAENIGVPKSVIGVSLVAFGTSLPELIVGVYSAMRKKVEFALGNILGSNIYNVLGILGISTFLESFKIPDIVANYDLLFMTFVTIFIFLFMFLLKKLNRLYGIISLSIYLTYIISMYL